ncbi:hypothetical protein ACWC24_14230 [Streptomyces sp. NPDC001443]
MSVLHFGSSPDLSTLFTLAIPLTVLTLGPAAWVLRHRKASSPRRLGNPAVKVAAMAALGCTAYSADTSWRFAADYLDIAGTAERVGMFAAAELALFATALMARQNLASQGVPGLPGTLVWGITAVQVIPAYAESGPVGGTVRAFVGPVMAAMLWHLAMGIELRLRTPGAASHGLIATLGRETRERLLSRLGMAARDRDAAQITRDRATARAVDLAARLSERTPAQQQSRRGRRLARQLSKAVGRAAVGTDPVQRAELLNQLAARRHALSLATVPLPSPWAASHVDSKTVTTPSSQSSSAGPPGNPAAVAAAGTDDRDRRTKSGDQQSGTAGRGPENHGASTWDHETGTGDRVAGTGDRVAGTGDRVAGTGDRVAGTGDRVAGTGGQEADKSPGQVPNVQRGPRSIESGTATAASPIGDHAMTTSDTGTVPIGDRGSTTPASKAKRGGQPRSPRTRRLPRQPEQSVEQLVERIRPLVPPVLARDGNETVTRVQLREILRREGLVGGRNDRLTFVLAALRNEDSSKATRSIRR